MSLSVPDSKGIIASQCPKGSSGGWPADDREGKLWVPHRCFLKMKRRHCPGYHAPLCPATGSF
jgi:hypothetical protein